jgi:hypothetical protein
MAYEWVGVVATAAVGLAGIAATWMLARANRVDQVRLLRLQHEEERKAALLDTKRKAYGELSANLSALILYAKVPGYDGADIQSLVSDLMRSLGEVEVLGSPSIIQLAPQVTEEVIRFLGLAVVSKEAMLNNKDRLAQWSNSVSARLFFMRRLMANDLGISTQHSMEEIEDEVDTLKLAEELLYLKKHEHEYSADPGVPKPNGDTDGTT